MVELNDTDPSMDDELEQHGYCLVPQCVATEELTSLEAALATAPLAGAGRRNLLAESPAVCEFAATELAALLRPVGTNDFFPVRALLFDKTPQTNWNVSWHQDLSIAVADRIGAEGFAGWSLKEGVWHVQPPAGILERMLTVRLHLDDCQAEHGPLRVIPGSHREGRLDGEAIAGLRERVPAQEICCRAGDALVMRPLLLHASSKATRPSRRRVLHVEFAAEDLPTGLRWASITSPLHRSAPALAGGRS